MICNIEEPAEQDQSLSKTIHIELDIYKINLQHHRDYREAASATAIPDGVHGYNSMACIQTMGQTDLYRSEIHSTAAMGC